MAKPSLTQEDITQILRLIDAFPDGEIEIEKDDLKLRVKKSDRASRDAPPATAALQKAQALDTYQASNADKASTNADAEPDKPSAAPPLVLKEGLVVVRAPMLGRFYRAPSPKETPFVEVGMHVADDDTVGLIEVMKLFTTIKAGAAGCVAAIEAESGSMVEFDQVLMTIRQD